MQFGLRDWANREPDRTAISVGGRRITYGELEASANRVAHLLRASGLRPGDHAAAILSNDPLMFALAWGAYRAGIYFTPISSASSLRDAAYVVANATARLVVVDASLSGLRDLPGAAEGAPAWFAQGGDVPGVPDLADALAAQPPTPLEDETPGALMMYTSGTTGAPKGVWRPRPIDPSGPPPFARDLLALFSIDSGSRYLSTQPLYHAAALRFGLAFLAAGGAVHVMSRFDAATALDALEGERITHSQWVPTMFGRLLALPEGRRARFSAPAHRCAIHAAAPCPVPVKSAMIRWWGSIIEEYYAGSEGVGMTKLGSAEWLGRPGSVGRCVRGELHILDDRGSELPPGQRGRIFFSGIAPFRYFGEPEKTAARTSPQGYQTLGDVGYVDRDGYLFLTDRLDDMIISGGVNLYPQEIEAALMEVTGVEDCAVVGLTDPDLGERAVAFVVARPDAGPAADLARTLDDHCRARLGRVKRPREIRLVESLPRSPAGKLLRRELKAGNLQRPGEPDEVRPVRDAVGMPPSP